jgi:hypothetical protein
MHSHEAIAFCDATPSEEQRESAPRLDRYRFCVKAAALMWKRFGSDKPQHSAAAICG